ncbi:MAG: NAD(P)-binding protein [Candidatus Limnocylindrales bacterium]|nr:NAD(P)-binding protein [Candidatus Limnocylindrales bacterium]
MVAAGSYDGIIVGAGHNGLVAAAYLARAGLRMLVLERRGIVGGACVTEEVWPGFHVSTTSYVNSMFQGRIIEDLGLGKFGFELIPTCGTGRRRRSASRWVATSARGNQGTASG